MYSLQRCIAPLCRATFDVSEVLTSCPDCGSLLDIDYEWDKLPVPSSLREFEAISAQDPGKHNPREKGWFDKVRDFFGP
jgi:threonine synthase